MQHWLWSIKLDPHLGLFLYFTTTKESDNCSKTMSEVEQRGYMDGPIQVFWAVHPSSYCIRLEILMCSSGWLLLKAYTPADFQ